MESSIKNYALDTLEAWRNFYKRVMSRAERTGKEGKGLYIPFTLSAAFPLPLPYPQSVCTGAKTLNTVFRNCP